VADTIDRKYRNVRAAQKTRQECRIVLDTAIVKKQAAFCVVDKAFQQRRLVGTAANVQHGQAVEIEPI
jgi:hypothetical protein